MVLIILMLSLCYAETFGIISLDGNLKVIME